jgi:Tfp pilus assembly protein PilF
MGRIAEADSVKKEVLGKNSVNISYRLNLSRYYLKTGNLPEVKDNLDAALKFDPKNINVWIVAASYNYRINNLEEARVLCGKILSAEPENYSARELLRKIEELQP